jgi:hypothetical protein
MSNIPPEFEEAMQRALDAHRNSVGGNYALVMSPEAYQMITTPPTEAQRQQWRREAYRDAKEMVDNFTRLLFGVVVHHLGHATLDDYNFFTHCIDNHLQEEFNPDGTLTEYGKERAGESYSENDVKAVFHMLHVLRAVAEEQGWHSVDDLWEMDESDE